MWIEGRGDLPGQLVVVSGPSGCGKSSLIRAALQRNELNAQLSVSATTRNPRPGERDGIDYHFFDLDEFAALRDSGGYLEYAEFNQNFYGTPAAPVQEALESGQSVILEIEVKGALQVREQAPSAFFLFVKTPSFRVLEHRLRTRGTESEASVLQRLRQARESLPKPIGMTMFWSTTTSTVASTTSSGCSKKTVVEGDPIMLEELKEEKIVNKVGGRFKLSTLIQKRMIALNQGARPLVDLRGADKMQIVIQEIMQDKIYLDLSGQLATNEPTDELDGGTVDLTQQGD